MTNPVRKLDQVPSQDRKAVIDHCILAVSNSHLIAIRLGDAQGVPYVDSMHSNTQAWVDDYHAAGGLWSYFHPQLFLAEYIDTCWTLSKANQYFPGAQHKEVISLGDASLVGC